MTTIEDLLYEKKISVRSYNVCKYNNLETVQDLTEYYSIHKTFDLLRNCGRKSNEELSSVVMDYSLEIVSRPDTTLEKDKNTNTIPTLNLSRIQREVINGFIKIQTNYLSNRSRNAISAHLNGNFQVRYFAEKLLLNKFFDPSKIENIGKKSIPELETYITLVKDFIAEVSVIDNEDELRVLKLRYFFVNHFSLKSIPGEILQDESIFRITDYLIQCQVLFESNYNDIAINSLRLYSNIQEQTLDTIAEKIGLTRERVRQIKSICLEQLPSKLEFLKSLQDEMLANYGIDESGPFIYIDEEKTSNINRISGVNFTSPFISIIIYIYLDNAFEIIGNIEDVLQHKFSKARNRHNWKNLYLISRELRDSIDIESLANDISKRLSDRIDETYSFNFKSYLSRFLHQSEYGLLEILHPIIEKIINEEFELYLDINDNLIFERTTFKTIPELIIEALEDLGEPTGLDVIYEWLERKYPNTYKSKESLRNSVKRDPKIIYFGRSSTYGLKKWEKTRNNIKGGTIKEIIYELIESKERPIHVDRLLKEIHKYREPTNERNVITNLKLDPNEEFIVFPQKFIGIKKHTHLYNLEKFENLPRKLGKILPKIMRINNLTNEKEIINYLKRHFNLTKKEANYIIKNIGIKL